MRLIRGFGTRARGESELAVIVEGKRPCGHVLTVTDKAPKKFRFTLVSRLQNYGLDAVENLYRANLQRQATTRTMRATRTAAATTLAATILLRHLTLSQSTRAELDWDKAHPQA